MLLGKQECEKSVQTKRGVNKLDTSRLNKYGQL